ncbi:helix-turn-helix transcriptional regulator [Bacillaceae bacterium S4-13-56]
MSQTFYTPEEVASLLKLSKYTIYEMIKRNEIKASRVGRRLRIDQKDLDTYLHQGEQKAVISHSVLEPIVFIGSHDPVMANFIEGLKPKITIFPSYVGSLEGLMALYYEKSDIAGCHLFDSETETYNIPYIKRLFPGEQLFTFTFMERTIGWGYKKDSGVDPSDWSLLKNHLSLANRQRGSGTRVVLDYYLRKHGINPNLVKGYKDECSTHDETASQVHLGKKDLGLLTEDTAKKWDLSFYPLKKEPYQWVMREEFVESAACQRLDDVFKDPLFMEDIQRLGINPFSLDSIQKIRG